MGNALVVGRAGNFVTSDLSNTFHVRLIGSEIKRTACIRERFQLSRDEAEKLVRQTDRSRANFVKRYAGADIDDTGAYHLILNTDNLSDEVLVRIIGDSVVEWANEKVSAPVPLPSPPKPLTVVR